MKTDELLWCLALSIERFAKAWEATENRKLDILQKQVELAGSPIPKKPDEPMPTDVWAHCHNYKNAEGDIDEWAVTDALSHAREMYDELGDWDKVRERLSLRM